MYCRWAKHFGTGSILAEYGTEYEWHDIVKQKGTMFVSRDANETNGNVNYIVFSVIFTAISG